LLLYICKAFIFRVTTKPVTCKKNVVQIQYWEKNANLSK